MKSFLTKTSLPLLLTLVLLACEEDNNGNNAVRGSGPVTTRTIDLPAVRGLDVSGAIDVVISQGSTQEVTVEGQANLIDILSTEVDDGVWEVSFTG